MHALNWGENVVKDKFWFVLECGNQSPLNIYVSLFLTPEGVDDKYVIVIMISIVFQLKCLLQTMHRQLNVEKYSTFNKSVPIYKECFSKHPGGLLSLRIVMTMANCWNSSLKVNILEVKVVAKSKTEVIQGQR